MLRLEDNPPMRPPSVGSVADLAGRWWAAHTHPRCEKALAWDLVGRGVGYFLPLVPRVTVSGGRKRRALIPLFTSYVFLCGTADDRQRALATGRVANLIPVHETARGQFVRELAAVEKAVVCGMPLDLYPFAAVGNRCRVTAGPFEGYEGTVVSRHGRARLVLHVSILGQGASVEIDADLLEPAG